MKKQMYFLKLDGMRGESNFPRHLGEIEIIGYSWSVNRFPSGGLSGERKASLNYLLLFKKIDKASHELFLARVEGKIFSEGLFTIEALSESGGLLHSTIVKLKSVTVGEFFSSDENEVETVLLECKSVET